MKLKRTISMLLVSAGLGGCGDSQPVDPSKLVTPTPEQSAAISAFDKSVSDEEFRKPEAGSKVPRSLTPKAATGPR